MFRNIFFWNFAGTSALLSPVGPPARTLRPDSDDPDVPVYYHQGMHAPHLGPRLRFLEPDVPALELPPVYHQGMHAPHLGPSVEPDMCALTHLELPEAEKDVELPESENSSTLGVSFLPLLRKEKATVRMASGDLSAVASTHCSSPGFFIGSYPEEESDEDSVRSSDSSLSTPLRSIEEKREGK